MADQKITELPIKTSTGINLTDYLLGIDSAEGYQMLVSDIAKKIVEDYAGSTLLGQAQSVMNAIEQCNSLRGGQIVSSGFNFDTCIDVGNYSIPTTSLANSATGTKPISVPIGYLKVLRTRDSGNVISQIFYEYSAVAVYYTRNYTVSSQTWSDWVKTPTRAEIDKISDINGIFSTNLAISGSSSEQYTVPNGSQHLVILHGASNTVHGLYLVAASPNGVMYSTEITKGTNLTVTTPSNNTLQIANAFTNGCYVTDICLRGSAITKVTAGTNSAQSESI